MANPLNDSFERADKAFEEARKTRTFINAAATTVIVFVLVVGGCTAHDNTYDPARLAEEAKIEAEKTKASIAQSHVREAEVATMAKLVEEGANPIAVRCMIEGWRQSDDVCKTIGLVTGQQKSEMTK